MLKGWSQNVVEIPKPGRVLEKKLSQTGQTGQTDKRRDRQIDVHNPQATGHWELVIFRELARIHFVIHSLHGRSLNGLPWPTSSTVEKNKMTYNFRLRDPSINILCAVSPPAFWCSKWCLTCQAFMLYRYEPLLGEP